MVLRQVSRHKPTLFQAPSTEAATFLSNIDPANCRVRAANAFIVMRGLGPNPVIARYQTCPTLSQLFPPAPLHARQNARFGGPLL